MKYISRRNFLKLLGALKKKYRVYVPVKKDNRRFYREYNEFTDDIVLGEVRPFEPLKSFFSRAREVVAEDFKEEIPHSGDKPFAVVGVKACDLKGFKVQDHVFLDHDYKDPFYIKNREENLIISSDCTCAIETCFCVALGDKPYSQENFDINISQVRGGFIVEIGSEKGQKLVDEHSFLFEKSKEALIAERNKDREKITEEINNIIKENNIPLHKQYKGIIEKNYESGIWADEAEECVECGACTMICPTCHCFLLYDQKDEERMARLRMWDSCMVKDYARVAGGANPRPKLWMRLRNRFEKKFDFFPKTVDMYACTGCGRCITACPGKIDIREILKRLVSGDKKK